MPSTSRLNLKPFPFSRSFSKTEQVGMSNAVLGISGSSAWSIGGWFFIRSFSSDGLLFDHPYSFGEPETNKGIVMGFFQGKGLIGFFSPDFFISNYTFPTNVWSHIVWTYSGGANGTATIYHNAAPVFSTVIPIAAPNITDTVLEIDDYYNTSHYFLDSLQNDIFTANVEVTRSQIFDIAYKQIYPAGIRTRYKMTEGFGSSLTDSSGNGNNGTLLLPATDSWSTSTVFLRTAASGRTSPSGRMTLPTTGNRLIRSEEFDNAVWGTSNSSVTANQVANPIDGAITADQITEDVTANTRHRIFQAIGNPFSPLIKEESYTASCFFKANTRTFAGIELDTGGSSTVTVNLLTGVIANSQIDALRIENILTNVEDFGGGWYRLSLTVKMLVTIDTVFASFALSNNGNSNLTYSGDGVSSAYFFGAQFVRANYAALYTSTTTTPVATQLRNKIV